MPISSLSLVSASVKQRTRQAGDADGLTTCWLVGLGCWQGKWETHRVGCWGAGWMLWDRVLAPQGSLHSALVESCPPLLAY